MSTVHPLDRSMNARGPAAGKVNAAAGSCLGPMGHPAESCQAQLSVALVSPGDPATTTNGIAAFTARIQPALESIGCKTTILTNCKGASPWSPCVLDLGATRRGLVDRVIDSIVARVSPQAGRDRQVVRSLRAGVRLACNDRGVQLVQMEETFGWAGRLVRQIDLPVVVRVAGPALINASVWRHDGRSLQRRQALELQGIRDAAGVVFQSRAYRSLVLQALGGELRRSVVIPNPAPAYHERELWRQSSAEAGRVLFVGRFDRLKGGDLVIDAWSQIAERFPASRLVLIGPDGGFHNEQGQVWSLPDYLTDRVPAGLRDRIECLGPQPPAAVEVERRRASVVVIASRIENFSNTVLEAMAMGCPVIASDSGGTPEIVGRDGAGVLFQSDNSTAFADAMEQCLADPDRAAAMGTEAHRRCVERFSLPKVAEMYVAFYREVLGTRD